MPTDVPLSPKSSEKVETAPPGEEVAAKPTSTELLSKSESIREEDGKTAGGPGTGRALLLQRPRLGQACPVVGRAGRCAGGRGAGRVSTRRPDRVLPGGGAGTRLPW